MKEKELFLQHISVERRLSEKTVEAYSISLTLFDDFLSSLPESVALIEADGDNIRDWMECLMEKGCSVAYVNRSLAAVRTFFRFCLSQGIVKADPAHNIVGPKKEKRLPRFLKDAEVNKLLGSLEQASVDEDGKPQFDVVRARTIIYVFYLTGLRVSELMSLDDSMVDLINKELKVTGKRNKQRIVPFGDELVEVLSRYVSLRDTTVTRTDDALFVNDKGRRMRYQEVAKIVKSNLGSVSSLAKCTPHVLRHTFATTMLNNEANLESIKKILGHQSLNATEIYTHTTFEQLKKIYNEAHPRQ